MVRDSASRETFSSTTLVLIFWILWVHKDSLNPIYFCLGEVGHPVAQYCSISPLKQDAKSAPEVGDGLPLQLPGVPGLPADSPQLSSPEFAVMGNVF